MLKLLSQLVISYSKLSSSTEYIETLSETSRRQNIREGLTNITDKSYLLFNKLNHAIRELETFQNLHEHGGKSCRIHQIQNFGKI